MMRSGIFASTQSDDNGNFVLGGLDAMGDKTEFVVQAIQENGSKDVYLKLDDNGKTLYWNPDIIISGGDQSHRFDFTLPPGDDYEIVIEGISSTGRTIHTRVPVQ